MKVIEKEMQNRRRKNKKILIGKERKKRGKEKRNCKKEMKEGRKVFKKEGRGKMRKRKRYTRSK